MLGAKRAVQLSCTSDLQRRSAPASAARLFKLLLLDPLASTAQVGSIAEKIRLSLAKPYVLTVQHPGQPDALVEHRCSVSIGVVVFIKQEADESNLLKWADTAMYQTKSAGRDTIRIYEEQVRP